MADRDREWEIHLRSLSSATMDAPDPASDSSLLNSVARLHAETTRIIRLRSTTEMVMVLSLTVVVCAGRVEVHVELLKPGSGDCGVEVNTFVERVNLDGGLGSGRESPLCTLTSGPKSTSTASDILVVLMLEFLIKWFIEIFTTEMGVTSSGLNLKNSHPQWSRERETSKVPPPRSKIKTRRHSFRQRSLLSCRDGRQWLQLKLFVLTLVVNNYRGLVTGTRDDLEWPEMTYEGVVALFIGDDLDTIVLPHA
ncbi:urease subunit alpha [Striga asiatica]|uniref:Urease subunit alpha n=1 Tax=Striga asiatica TaxID=4170 RepID=A0A5A7QRG1_STRAF|nr:urease subunit alpha [Striga asiatica]